MEIIEIKDSGEYRTHINRLGDWQLLKRFMAILDENGEQWWQVYPEED